MSQHAALMRQAVQLAHENRERGGRPFGAVLVRGSEVIATGINEIVQSHDPSTHAEMQAIRTATRAQKNPSLAGCSIYASGHPCPMCLAALVMTGVESVFFAFDNDDAAPYQLSSEGTYQRLRLNLTPPPLPITRVDTGITAAQLYGEAPWPEESK
ncbi:nucleoside deaminase [Diaphorobacter sp. HDW4A]|uniref:nucleoside deaminase n=1 Tax=Diaphorobacter sp. HDW4A TaxID=2714924 RepID=UPI001409386A|nr:nucleoside deaminase [Diaphorobacter sp. HDW4A]QIL80653.1 nucleoside deaminase [Diaphorobacter sp. HDW4A]